jgi:hypothetical protein
MVQTGASGEGAAVQTAAPFSLSREVAMSGRFERQVADEVARRAARRLAILREERPDLLAERFASLDPETLSELLELTRLPEPLRAREPRYSHVGVEGVDHCMNRLVVRRPRRARGGRTVVDHPDLASLDDEDLLAARRYLPDTLPGNVLG